MKIVTILGARPQFIKAAVVSRAIAQLNKEKKDESIKEVIIHTGQHYDENMSEIFFNEMTIPAPSIKLNINQLSHGAMTGRMLEQIENVLIDENPDWVLVYGDTNSTLAGALAAVKLHIPVAHVEAGLRSYNKNMPEEHNRVLTDHLSSVLFCPTRQAVMNLEREGIGSVHTDMAHPQFQSNGPQVYRVGDVMYDASIYYAGISSNKAHWSEEIIDTLAGNKRFALATVHREENTDLREQLESIIDAFLRLSENTPIIWPIHPRTRKMLLRYDLEDRINGDSIIPISPVGYLDMIELLQKCSLVLTDSGGVQKEAYFFKKPCITLRNETEWVELIDHGFNTIVGTDTDRIVKAAHDFLRAELDFNMHLYGSGNAGHQIVTVLDSCFNSYTKGK